MNVADLFCSDRDGNALIQVDGSRLSPRTHRDFRRRVLVLADSLRAHGACRGDRIMILSGNRVELVESVLATIRAGACAVPVNPALGADPILHVIEVMQPRCCIFDGQLAPRIRAAFLGRNAVLVSLSPENPERGFLSYEALLAAGSGCTLSDTAAEEPPGPALVMHTSGSEGRPKPIYMTHRSIENFFECHDFLYSQFADSETADVSTSPIVSALSLNHFGGLAICLQGLMTDRPVYVLPLFVPSTYLRLLHETRCTVSMLAPTMYRALLNEPELSRYDLSALRFCISLGEPCPPELANRIRERLGAVVASAYGMTECLTGIGHAKRDLFGGSIKPGSCGTHCFGEIRLLDPDGRAAGDTGELWVRNKTVYACYGDPQLNAERLRDGWFRTRDLFYRDPAGHFFHRGRSDDMFVHNGKNVYPVEIESLLLRHPHVEQVCAAALRTSDGRNVPGVMVRTCRQLAEVDIIDFALRNGPPHLIPKCIVLAPRLPEIGPGKVDRAAAGRILQERFDGPAARIGIHRS